MLERKISTLLMFNIKTWILGIEDVSDWDSVVSRQEPLIYLIFRQIMKFCKVNEIQEKRLFTTILVLSSKGLCTYFRAYQHIVGHRLGFHDQTEQ